MRNNKWLLILFGFILVGLLLCSCTTQCRCLRKFPPQTVIEIRDTIITRDSVVYKDRVVYDTIPGDTVYKEKRVPILRDIHIDPIEAENTYSYARAWVENQRLKLELQTKEQVIKRILENAQKETIHWQAQYRLEKQKNERVIYKPRQIHKASLWLNLIFILLLLLFIYLKVK